MPNRGRPRHPDILTPREWEVLELLRQHLSNGQIAESLGISERTAKFHVSEILAKLGVATREEAAAIAVAKRQRWWAAWPLWARIAGAAMLSVAVAGLAVLSWGVARTGPGDKENGASPVNPDVSALYDRIHNAMDRPGLVLHTTIDGSLEGSGETNDWLELWIDGPRNVARRKLNVDPAAALPGNALVGIYQENEWFSLMDNGEVGRFEVEPRMLCSGSSELVVALLLECGWVDSAEDVVVSQSEDTPPYVEGPAIVLAADKADQNEGQDFVRTYRLYVDSETFLPIARTVAIEGAVPFAGITLYTYRNEFVSRDSLPTDFLDPNALHSTTE